MSTFWAAHWQNEEGREMVDIFLREPVSCGMDWIRDPNDDYEMDGVELATFQHLFGLLPAPGQALQIDPSVWVHECSVCGKIGGELDIDLNPMQADKDALHIFCHEHGEERVVYHARIVSVKNLEDAKP